MVAIAAAICNVPEVCGRPCRDDSVIDVPTNSVGSNSVGSSSVGSMTLCEEGDLGYKIAAAGYKASNLDATTLNEMLQIAAAVCTPPEICGRPCRDNSESSSQTNNQVSNFDPVQDIVKG